MNTLLKKILIILVIILILILAALLVYNFIIKKPSGEEGKEQGSEPENAEEDFTPSPTLKIKSISTEKVLAPTLSADKTKIIYYSQYNGNVWQTAFDGSGLTRISSAVLDNLKRIIWSPDKTKVISIYQDEQENISKYFYNYTTGQTSVLSNNIQEIAWSPANDKIAYQYTNDLTGENNISAANPDGAIWRNIFQMRMKNVNLDWVGSKIAFYEKPSGLAQSSLFLLDPLTKGLTKVLSNIYGMSVKWSPQGDKALYSKTNDQGKNIKLYIGEMDTDIPTLAEKCVWSQDNRTVFCAVPKEIDSNAILPDDFYKNTFVSNDEFWKINLEINEKTALLKSWERGEGIYDAVDLFLSPLEDYLFFVNKYDGLLYSIEL